MATGEYLLVDVDFFFIVDIKERPSKLGLRPLLFSYICSAPFSKYYQASSNYTGLDILPYSLLATKYQSKLALVNEEEHKNLTIMLCYPPLNFNLFCALSFTYVTGLGGGSSYVWDEYLGILCLLSIHWQNQL